MRYTCDSYDGEGEMYYECDTSSVRSEYGLSREFDRFKEEEPYYANEFEDSHEAFDTLSLREIRSHNGYLYESNCNTPYGRKYGDECWESIGWR